MVTIRDMPEMTPQREVEESPVSGRQRELAILAGGNACDLVESYIMAGDFPVKPSGRYVLTITLEGREEGMKAVGMKIT